MTKTTTLFRNAYTRFLQSPISIVDENDNKTARIGSVVTMDNSEGYITTGVITSFSIPDGCRFADANLVTMHLDTSKKGKSEQIQVYLKNPELSSGQNRLQTSDGYTVYSNKQPVIASRLSHADTCLQVVSFDNDIISIYRDDVIKIRLLNGTTYCGSVFILDAADQRIQLDASVDFFECYKEIDIEDIKSIELTR